MTEKRIHFKGRGKTERPVCPQCGEDLQRSYTYQKKPNGKWQYVSTGWECTEHRYKEWNNSTKA
jgi:hypothetical protein